MSITPLITFKAGECDSSDSRATARIKCKPTPGYIYLYVDEENELTHFCWRARSKPADDPDLDLIMLPGDGSFTPYKPAESATNGRIFVLKFTSSSSRHFFWLQSKSQHPEGKDDWFSERDLKLGQIVDALLSGEEVDVQGELSQIGRGPGRPDGDHDEDMQDAPPQDNELSRTSTGGAGADATGGDVREEGHEAREGGADGGRAAAPLPTNASDAVQNFLRSLGGGNVQQQRQQQNIFTTLSDLMTPETCIATLKTATPTHINALLTLLPPQILLLAQEADDLTDVDFNSETAQAAIEALTLEQKKDILTRVFRSPQLHQSLGSLTMALRDGGLPMVAESLGIKVANGGLIRGGQMPLGEGDAVEAFLEGVKTTVKEEDDENGEDREGGMDTS